MKAPGLDGYTPELYKNDGAYTGFHTSFRLSKDIYRGEYLPSGYQVHIKLIAKKGTEPGSYMPISLLNLDKILSKIMANRLAKILPTLIGPAQSGFTQGRSTASNIQEVLAILEYEKTHLNSDMAIISLNAKKAFDNISFSWLPLVLQCFGFSSSLLQLISIMYASPTANIVAAGLELRSNYKGH